MNISLIDFKGRKNRSQYEILKSINNYLLRNKGAISDFMLVKDIVDRNTIEIALVVDIMGLCIWKKEENKVLKTKQWKLLKKH